MPEYSRQEHENHRRPCSNDLGEDGVAAAAAASPRADPWSGDSSGIDVTVGKHLLVASTGGHLAELQRLAERWHVSKKSEWVTFEGPQRRQLQEQGRTVHAVPYVVPRDLRAVVHASKFIRRTIVRGGFDSVISTGAAVALSAGIAASTTRTPMVYVESLARLEGPSLSGRILSFVPNIRLRTQVPDWAAGRWTTTPSVLSTFRPAPAAHAPSSRPRLLVTVGTIAPYRFDRLVDAVLATGLAGSDTVWQLGTTSRVDLPGTVHNQLSPDQLQEAIRSAEVVVAHAGVGTLLDVLGSGKMPVVVPRRAVFGEHVDDHQSQLAQFVSDAGLAIAVDADKLDADHLLRAAASAVQTVS